MGVRRLTADKLAAATGINKYTIDRFTSGRTKPTQRFVEAFLMAFPDVSPDWLRQNVKGWHNARNGHKRKSLLR